MVFCVFKLCVGKGGVARWGGEQDAWHDMTRDTVTSHDQSHMTSRCHDMKGLNKSRSIKLL